MRKKKRIAMRRELNQRKKKRFWNNVNKYRKCFASAFHLSERKRKTEQKKKKKKEWKNNQKGDRIDIIVWERCMAWQSMNDTGHNNGIY